MIVWYLPLEAYEERYTAQLADWTLRRFKRHEIQVNEITPDLTGWTQTSTIKTGVALDAHGRTRYALRQTEALIDALQADAVKADDVIYLQDLYQPGFDALLYVLEQQFGSLEKGPRIYTHNLAQTIDPDDFTHSWRWMRHYEHLVDEAVLRSDGGVFYASTEHKQLADVAGFRARAHVVGLLHDRDAVQSMLLGRSKYLPSERAKRIVYTSRFDSEKQPHFFMDLAERLRMKDWEIAVLTSSPVLRSNDASAIQRIWELQSKGTVVIRQGLSKRQYYELLADSRLQINTARQDWVSNTLLESSALGTPTLAPAYRGFPEALFNNDRMLYVPWSITDATVKAWALLGDPPDPETIARPSKHHHATLDRVIHVIRYAT